MKEKLKEKVSGQKEEDTSVPIEKYEEAAPTHETEKKGFLDKIKEKLPGGKKTEEVVVAAPPHPPPAEEYHAAPETEGDKKGFLEKIKEKIPGFHSKTDEEKEKEKEKY